jgi:hypothetical protein
MIWPVYIAFLCFAIFFTAFAVSLTMMWVHSFIGLMNNSTQVEQVKGAPLAIPCQTRPPFKTRHVYDMGPYVNLKQMLGSNVLLWLIPIQTTKGNGLVYPTFPLVRSDDKAMERLFEIEKRNGIKNSSQPNDLNSEFDMEKIVQKALMKYSDKVCNIDQLIIINGMELAKNQIIAIPAEIREKQVREEKEKIQALQNLEEKEEKKENKEELGVNESFDPLMTIDGTNIEITGENEMDQMD